MNVAERSFYRWVAEVIKFFDSELHTAVLRVSVRTRPLSETKVGKNRRFMEFLSQYLVTVENMAQVTTDH